MASADEVAVKFQKLATALSGPAIRQVGNEIGMAAKDDVAAEVRKDAGGNLSLSGWRRKAPIDTGARYEFKDQSSVVVRPVKPTGVMRVLNDGRHPGTLGDFAGPGVNRKTGARNFTKAGKVAKMRAKKAKRWNGHTTGKGTWDDAMTVVVRETPDRAMKTLMDGTVRKLFKG